MSSSKKLKLKKFLAAASTVAVISGGIATEAMAAARGTTAAGAVLSTGVNLDKTGGKPVTPVAPGSTLDAFHSATLDVNLGAIRVSAANVTFTASGNRTFGPIIANGQTANFVTDGKGSTIIFSGVAQVALNDINGGATYQFVGNADTYDGLSAVTIASGDKIVIRRAAGDTTLGNNTTFQGAGTLQLSNNVTFKNALGVDNGAGVLARLEIDDTRVATVTHKGDFNVTDTVLGGANAELKFTGAASFNINGNITGAGLLVIDNNGNTATLNGDIGTSNAALAKVSLGGAAGATTLNVTDGRSIYATLVDVGVNGVDNILKLGKNTQVIGDVYDALGANKGLIHVNGDTTVKSIGAGNKINGVVFNGDHKLTVQKNDPGVGINGVISFVQGGTLELLDNSVDFNLAGKVIAAAGKGLIIADNAGAGKTITLGDVLDGVGGNGVEFGGVQARGGANVKLVATNKDFAIGTVDIGTQNSRLILSAAAAKTFTVGKFVHADGKGIIELNAANNATVAKGSVLSSATNRLDSVQLTNGAAGKSLILGDGVDLYTVNGIIATNASIGNSALAFEGDSVISGNVGVAGKTLGQINLSTTANKTVTFEGDILLTAAGGAAGVNDGVINFKSDSTVSFGGKVIAIDIVGAANKGKIIFNNSVALTGNNAVAKIGGGGAVGSVTLAGQDVQVTGNFNTKALVFNGNQTLILDDAAAANIVLGTVTTANDGQGNIKLTKSYDYTITEDIGADGKALGNIEFNTTDGTKTLTIDKNFYARAVASVAGQGNVVLGKAATPPATVLHIGSSTNGFNNVQLANDTTIKGDVWAKSLDVNNKTATFEGNNTVLDATIDNAGVATFKNNIAITKVIGGTTPLTTVNFAGANNNIVARVGANISATNVNIDRQTVELTAATTFTGITNVSNGGRLSLGTNKLISDGNLTFTAGSVKTAFNNGNLGNIQVSNGNLVSNGVTEILVDDRSTLTSGSQAYQLLETAKAAVVGSGTDEFKAGTKVTSSNRFAEWTLQAAANQKQNLVRVNAVGKGLKGAGVDAATADAYNNFTDGSDAAKFLTDIAFLSDEKVKEAMDRVTNTVATAQTQIVSQDQDSAINNINNRIGALSNHPLPGIQTASSGEETGFAAGDDVSMYGAWLSPFYNSTTQKKKSGTAGYKSQAYGATLGFDMKANADLTVGIAGSYASSDVKHKDFKSGDKTKVRTLMLSLYGVQQLTDNWFLQGNVSFATSNFKNREKRLTSTGYETANGKFDSTSFSTEMLAGYNYSMNDAMVTPMMGARFTRVNSGSYKETGTTNQNLQVNSKDANKFEVLAGMRAQMSMETNGIDLTPEFHAFVRHDLIGKGVKVRAEHSGVKGLAGKSSKAQRTVFNVGLAVNAKQDMYEYGAGYDLFLSQKSTGHQGTLKLKVNF